MSEIEGEHFGNSDKSVNHEKLEKIEKVTIEVKSDARDVQKERIEVKIVPEEPKTEEKSEEMKPEENPFPRKGSVRSKERRKEILKSIGKRIIRGVTRNMRPIFASIFLVL